MNVIIAICLIPLVVEILTTDSLDMTEIVPVMFFMIVFFVSRGDRRENISVCHYKREESSFWTNGGKLYNCEEKLILKYFGRCVTTFEKKNIILRRRKVRLRRIEVELMDGDNKYLLLLSGSSYKAILQWLEHIEENA